MKQNIYDNTDFFDGYKRIRDNIHSANNLEEKPAFFALLPPLKGLRILDLGCGYGENCNNFSDLGASFVMGIDISERMLSIARSSTNDKKIVFKKLCMEDIGRIDDKFDIVTSSLAVHYVKDFFLLVKSVFSLLKTGGLFIFSQEHPLITAPKKGMDWDILENGQISHYQLSDYPESGLRKVFWIVDGVIKYHRQFSDIINPLLNNGFQLLEIAEPKIAEKWARNIQDAQKSKHVPNFLIVKAKKT